MPNAANLLPPLLIAAGFALAACGGGGFGEGDVSCEPLSALGAYRYQAIGITELRETKDPPLVITGARKPSRFVMEFDGVVQAPDKISVVSRAGDGVDFLEGQTVAIGEKEWLFLDLWVERGRSPISIPFVPLDACNAIAPDLSLAELTSTAEAVNDIASRRYQFEVQNEFFGRHINYQLSHEASRLIETVTVDVWIAEDGRYPIKLSVKGSGETSDGLQILAEVGYEIFDVGAPDIVIEPPCSDDCR